MNLFKDCGCGCNGAIAQQKFIISLFSACIFYIIMNKETFKLTNKYIGNWIMKDDCPTRAGFLLHTVVFTAIAFATMMIRDQANIDQKMRISILSGLLFYLIANPVTFKLVSDVIGRWVASATGCPTTAGVLLHTAVFVLVIYVTMNGRRVKKCNCGA